MDNQEKECTNKDCGCDVNQQQVPTNVATEEKKEPELTADEKAKLEKQRAYFNHLRQGALTLRFIIEDIRKQTQVHCNRPQRRRIEKELRNGVMSTELVDLYMGKMDMLLEYIENRLNPKPVEPTQDGAEFFAKAKEAEAKGELKEQSDAK